MGATESMYCGGTNACDCVKSEQASEFDDNREQPMPIIKQVNNTNRFITTDQSQEQQTFGNQEITAHIQLKYVSFLKLSDLDRKKIHADR